MDELLKRIEAVEARLIALAPSPTTCSLTDPEPGGTERWEATQVWAHIAEFGDYWLDELDALIASDDPSKPFGRVKSNPARIAAIETGRHRAASANLDTARAAFDRLRTFLSDQDDVGWARTANHQTLGVLSMHQVMEEFLVGHYEQHADQLEAIS